VLAHAAQDGVRPGPPVEHDDDGPLAPPRRGADAERHLARRGAGGRHGGGPHGHRHGHAAERPGGSTRPQPGRWRLRPLPRLAAPVDRRPRASFRQPAAGEDEGEPGGRQRHAAGVQGAERRAGRGDGDALQPGQQRPGRQVQDGGDGLAQHAGGQAGRQPPHHDRPGGGAGQEVRRQ
jgi:hypothetical protein